MEPLYPTLTFELPPPVALTPRGAVSAPGKLSVPQGGISRPLVRCRRALGRGRGLHRRRADEGADARDASDPAQSHPRGPHGHHQRLRMSRLQDTDARAHLRLDLQPEDKRKSCQVGPGWCGSAPRGLDLMAMENSDIFICKNLQVV